MRLRMSEGEVWIETKCSKSGCGKLIEVRLPHPLTGSHLTAAVSLKS